MLDLISIIYVVCILALNEKNMNNFVSKMFSLPISLLIWEVNELNSLQSGPGRWERSKFFSSIPKYDSVWECLVFMWEFLYEILVFVISVFLSNISFCYILLCLEWMNCRDSIKSKFSPLRGILFNVPCNWDWYVSVPELCLLQKRGWLQA